MSKISKQKKRFFSIEKEAYKFYRDLTPHVTEDKQSRLKEYATIKVHRSGIINRGIPATGFAIVN